MSEFIIKHGLSTECSSILAHSIKNEMISYTEVQVLLEATRGMETFVGDMCNLYPKFQQNFKRECPQDRVVVVYGDGNTQYDVTNKMLTEATSHLPQNFCTDPCYVEVAKKIDLNNDTEIVCSP